MDFVINFVLEQKFSDLTNSRVASFECEIN